MTTVNSIDNMAASLADDESIKKDMAIHAADCRLTHLLIVLRNAGGLTQRDVAKKMKCDASKISRIEAGSDKQLRWGDVVSYLGALNVRMSVLVDAQDLDTSARIKHHIFAIDGLLKELSDMARKCGEDAAFCAGIDKFYHEVLWNFMRRFCDCYSRLPTVGPVMVTPDKGLTTIAGQDQFSPASREAVAAPV